MQFFFLLPPSLLISKRHCLSEGVSGGIQGLKIKHRMEGVHGAVVPVEGNEKKRQKCKKDSKNREVMWCKSDPVVSWDVLCWKKFPLFLVILNVLCLFFGFSVLSYLFLDHTCMYKENLVFWWNEEMKMECFTHWVAAHTVHADTHTDKLTSCPSCKILNSSV